MIAQGSKSIISAVVASPGDIAIGKAMQSWQPPVNEETGEIIMNENSFVLTYILDPQPAPVFNTDVLTSFLLEKTGDGYYTVKNTATDTVIKPVTALASAVIGNLEAGLVTTQELIADTIQVNTQLVSPLVETDRLNTDLISPLASSDIIIDLTASSSASPAGTLLVKGDASISGTLHVDNLEGQTISQITQNLDLLSDQYATASGILADIQARYSSYDDLVNPQDSSDPLDTSSLDTTNATVSADIALGVDGSLVLDDLMVSNTLIASSLSSNLDNTLYIQPLANAPLNLLAGLMTLSPDGKVTVNGDLWVTGSIMAQNLESLRSTIYDLTTQNATVAGQLTLGEPSGFGTIIASYNEDLNIQLATSSASLNLGIDPNTPVASINATGQANFTALNLSQASGQILLPAGEKTITINNTTLTPFSQIVATFTSDYSPATKYWATLNPDIQSFTIHLDYPVNQDTTVNYLIIN